MGHFTDATPRSSRGSGNERSLRGSSAAQWPAPILLRIETRAGHGRGTPVSKLIENAADRWAFLVKYLGMDVPARE